MGRKYRNVLNEKVMKDLF